MFAITAQELDFSDDDSVPVHGSPSPPFTPQASVMRVDIANPNILDPGDLQLEHQKHVVQQYSAQNLHQGSNLKTGSHRNESKPHSGTSISLNKPMTLIDDSTDLRSGDVSLLLTPKVNLTDTWQASKSLPANAHSRSSRPHSCHQTESVKQLSKQEPHMATFSPISSSTSPNLFTTPFSHTHSVGGLDSSGTASQHSKPPRVIYNAWAVPNPSKVTSKPTRLMSR